MRESSNSETLLYAIDESPPIWMVLVLGFQHILVMYGEMAIFPGMAGKIGHAPAEHIAFATFAAILVSALCTLVQVVRVGKVGAGFVIFMGSSTAYLACATQAVEIGGFALAGTMAILTAPVELLLSYFLRHLRHIVTPAVGGTVILLIVISFMPTTIQEWMGEPGSIHFGSPQNLSVGLITLGIILGINISGNKTLKVWCPIIALGLGYVAAWTFGILDFHHVREAPWFGLPHGSWPGLALDLGWEHLPIFSAFLVVTVLNSVQTIGNCMLAQSVSVRDFKKVDYDRVQGGLYADGLSSIAAGLAGTIPNETYSENIPILRMTGVASRSVGVFAVFVLLVLAFMPKLSAVILDMPEPVFAGFLVGILAMMFHSGLHLILETGADSKTGLLVGVSVCVGMIAENRDFFPALIPPSLAPVLDSGIAAGGLIALIMSTAFYLMPKPRVLLRVAPSVDELPTLVTELDAATEALKLSSRELSVLQVACEEVFVHVVSHFVDPNMTGSVEFHITKDEDGVFVEIQTGTRLSDVDGPKRPSEAGWVDEADLQALGLYLLRNLVREIKHVHISGYSYVSFRV
jgi:uracil-xanthine permease